MLARLLGAAVWLVAIGMTTCDGEGVATFNTAMSYAGARDSTRALTVEPSILRSVT